MRLAPLHNVEPETYRMSMPRHPDTQTSRGEEGEICKNLADCVEAWKKPSWEPANKNTSEWKQDCPSGACKTCMSDAHRDED